MIIDQYDTVKPLNKPIKENILATKYLKSEVYLGGVFAACLNLSQFNSNVTMCTSVGKDKDIKKIINKIPKNINKKIFYENSKITTRKKIYRSNYNKKISEVYFMDDDFLSQRNSNKISHYLNKNLHRFDVVIPIDYGHGLINDKMFRRRKKAKSIINCQTTVQIWVSI